MAFDMNDFGDCIVGVVEQIGRSKVVCYDYDKVIDKMMHTDGMSYEDAVEYFEFNIGAAYIGAGNPAFMYRGDEDDVGVLLGTP